MEPEVDVSSRETKFGGGDGESVDGEEDSPPFSSASPPPPSAICRRHHEPFFVTIVAPSRALPPPCVCGVSSEVVFAASHLRRSDGRGCGIAYSAAAGALVLSRMGCSGLF